MVGSCFYGGPLFPLKTRIDSVVEIERFILPAYATSLLTSTSARTCNGKTHLIISCNRFSHSTNRAHGIVSWSTISPGPIVYVLSQRKVGRINEYHIVYLRGLFGTVLG